MSAADEDLSGPPSTITSVDFIFARYRSPLTDFDDSGESSSESGDDSGESSDDDCRDDAQKMLTKCGKWMLFFDCIEKDSDGLTELDRMWFKVKAIAENGDLPTACCSTAYLDGHHDGSSQGVICIYSNDYDDEDDVGRVADKIRQKIDYSHDMYYKTDIATRKNLYRYNGDKQISMYKHAIRRSGETKFLKRDETGFWTPVGFDKRGANSSNWRSEARQ